MDLKLDESGDLAWEDGDFVLLGGDEEVAQAVAFNVNSTFGEFEYAPDEGLRVDLVLGHRGEDLRPVEAELKRAISYPAGVQSLSSFEMEFDEDTGALEFEFEAELASGASAGGEGTFDEKKGDIDLLVWVV